MPPTVAPTEASASLSPETWRRMTSRNSAMKATADIEQSIAVRSMSSSDVPKRMNAAAPITSSGEECTRGDWSL